MAGLYPPHFLLLGSAPKSLLISSIIYTALLVFHAGRYQNVSP